MAQPTSSSKLSLAGNVLTGLVTLAMLASAGSKLAGAKEIVDNFAKFHLGDYRVAIAVIEILCAALFALPKTAPLGTMLVTGYFGGAIVAHLGAADAAGIVPALALGAVAWLATYLRGHKAAFMAA